jgi:hypothetical protein
MGEYYTLKSGIWISTYIIFTRVKGKEDLRTVAIARAVS